MRRYDSVQGLPVFSVREGHRAGTVTQALLDKRDKRVTGFLVEREGGAGYALPVEAIEAYGTDAVMIASEDALGGEIAPGAPAREERNPVLGSRVVTRSGTYVGDIASFYFDEGSGQITHFEISGGMFRDMMHGRGLVPREGIVTLGVDVCVAEDSVKEITTVMKSEPGMRNRTLALKNRMEHGMRGFKDKSRQWAHNMGRAFSLHGTGEHEKPHDRDGGSGQDDAQKR